MTDAQLATPQAPPTAREPLRRDRERGLVAGVCAGIARHVGIDPLIVRVAFVAAATAGGAGLALYLLGWVFLDDEAAGEARTPRRSRAGVETALGVGLLTLAFLLAMRATGIWFSDAVVWPAALVGVGAALLWRQAFGSRTPPAAPAAATAPAAPPTLAEERRERAQVLSVTGLGAGFVIAAGVVFLYATDSLTAVRDVVLAVLVAAVVLGVIFAPWVTRLVRSLAAERAERVRSQARAEMGAHLHDSVLQTLALVQKRADDPRAVAALARTQERELRAWLAGREGGHERLAAALEGAAGEVEGAHGANVEVVVVGDAELGDATAALVAASREAMVNAAKFAPGSPVDVYAEVSGDRVSVFVRDRGPGFDPAAVPADRRGVRESIVGRMARHGGHADIHAAPGGGTEVELTLPVAP
jgi:signal transduction histidine kinase/phage shock protein PspC (stress-responsive transcriptional regulator)